MQIKATQFRALSRKLASSLGERLRGESGMAALEFLFLGVVLLIPLVYLVITTMSIQLAYFAAESTARTLARAETIVGRSDANRNSIVATVLGDYGFKPGSYKYRVECQPSCAPGNRVRVRVAIEVPLPLVPDSFGSLKIAVARGEVTMPISRYYTRER